MQYRVTLIPAKPKLTVQVSADSAEKFSATVTDLDLTGARLEPDGNWLDKALETLVKPLVQMVVDKMPSDIAQRVKGKRVSFTLKEPIGFQVDVHDVSIKLTATDLALGTHEGHLLVTGGIEVTS